MFIKESFFKLRPYQETAVASLENALNQGIKRILLVAPTGSGKTAISSELKRRYCETALKEGRRPVLLFVVHVLPLIEQTINTLIATGFDPSIIGVIGGNYPENRNASIQIISLAATSHRDLSWLDWDVCFFDEGHTTGFQQWGVQLSEQNPDRQIIYLTATTWRLSKREAFQQLVPEENWLFAPMPSELIAMGALATPRYFKELAIDTSSISVHGGEFSRQELSIASNDRKVIEAGLRFWQNNYPDERTIVFCVDVTHAESVAKIAKEWGRKVAIVTSGTKVSKDKENPGEGTREYYYKALDAGIIDMIVSVDCLSEGFDCKNIRCGWGLRPTKSTSKFYQQLGRILRPHPDKPDAIFLDQAGNLLYEDENGNVKGRFPLVEDLIPDDFKDELNLKKGKRPPPRICIERNPWTWEIPEHPKGCGNVVSPLAKICPSCGFVLPVRKRRTASTTIVEVEGKKGKSKKLPPTKEQIHEWKWYSVELFNTAYERRYKPGYPFMQFRERFRKNIPREYYKGWAQKYKKLPEADFIEWMEAVAPNESPEERQAFIEKELLRFGYESKEPKLSEGMVSNILRDMELGEYFEVERVSGKDSLELWLESNHMYKQLSIEDQLSVDDDIKEHFLDELNMEVALNIS